MDEAAVARHDQQRLLMQATHGLHDCKVSYGCRCVLDATETVTWFSSQSDAKHK